jgi:hypothetical protein
MNLTLEIVRIVMRYISGALVAWGFLSPDDAGIFLDAHFVEVIAGVLLAVMTEAGYAVAKWRERN